MHVLLLNGPNLDLLGEREPETYGRTTLPEIEADLVTAANARGATLTCRQSNHEGALIEHLHTARKVCDGLILNPAGYGHTSVALRDALLAVALPFVEVHLSHPARREPFRRRSFTADLAIGVISGFGAYGYRLALDALLHSLNPPRAT